MADMIDSKSDLGSSISDIPRFKIQEIKCIK